MPFSSRGTFTVGADGMGVSVFYNHSKDTPGGAMWASPPTLGTSVFSQINKLGRQKCRPFMRIYS